MRIHDLEFIIDDSMFFKMMLNQLEITRDDSMPGNGNTYNRLLVSEYCLMLQQISLCREKGFNVELYWSETRKCLGYRAKKEE